MSKKNSRKCIIRLFEAKVPLIFTKSTMKKQISSKMELETGRIEVLQQRGAGDMMEP